MILLGAMRSRQEALQAWPQLTGQEAGLLPTPNALALGRVDAYTPCIVPRLLVAMRWIAPLQSLQSFSLKLWP